jgi:ubiquinone/menaquinone biosynthesis C-methylase UbiE
MPNVTCCSGGMVLATILRTWSYQYQWFYDTISRLAALSVGGETRLRRLPLAGLNLAANAAILDLCCGCGQTTQILLSYSPQVTGLDASPLSLQRAKAQVPRANYVEAFAESIPFAAGHFDLVHTSLALHEMTPDQRQQILAEVWRVLKTGGQFVFLDLHRPHQPLLWPGLALFLVLFETETAWQMLASDLVSELQNVGFKLQSQRQYAGGSLQTICAQKV